MISAPTPVPSTWSFIRLTSHAESGAAITPPSSIIATMPAVDAGRAEGEQEAGARGDRDDELRATDGADDLARLHPAGGHQRRGRHRAPAAAAARVEEAADEAERDQGPAARSLPRPRRPARRRLAMASRAAAARRPWMNRNRITPPRRQQDERDHRPSGVERQVREDDRAEERPDAAGDADRQEHPAVDVARASSARCRTRRRSRSRRGGPTRTRGPARGRASAAGWST